MSVEDKIIILLKELVSEIVSGNYTKISKCGWLGNFTEDDLLYIFNQGYSGKVTLPPNNAFSNIRFYKYDDNSGYSIEFNLWFDNRVSDLTLSCNVEVDFGSEQIKKFEIEEIEVL
ncbi:DUF7668 domain-containing protein [Brevibacillus sp. SYSU BS000544]|uniref:DUF7668 domain-containing protein n=1 Tax=Brevibacillus sp. SYSU BS000544 TaxID=3416443 RepID=UPI003CE5C191